jgi:hypothetical protein
MRRRGITKDTHHTRSLPIPPPMKGGAGGAPVASAVEDELGVGVAVWVSVNCSVVPTAVGLADLSVDADAEDVEETNEESIIEVSAEDDSDAAEVDATGPVDEISGRAVITVAVEIVVAVAVVVVIEFSSVKVGTMMELETETEVARDGSCALEAILG